MREQREQQEPVRGAAASLHEPEDRGHADRRLWLAGALGNANLGRVLGESGVQSHDATMSHGVARETLDDVEALRQGTRTDATDTDHIQRDTEPTRTDDPQAPPTTITISDLGMEDAAVTSYRMTTTKQHYTRDTERGTEIVSAVKVTMPAGPRTPALFEARSMERRISEVTIRVPQGDQFMELVLSDVVVADLTLEGSDASFELAYGGITMTTQGPEGTESTLEYESAT